MKKTILLAVAAFLIIPVAVLASKKTPADPTVMRIGGNDVKMSEFEYLYKKNNAQLASDMTLDKYIDMFVNYKLKVCAAKDAGIDTTESYLRDMQMYSSELSAPYMIDREMLDSLVSAAYSHKAEIVTVHHLLLPYKLGEKARRFALADSIRSAVAAGADFEELIRKYSADPMAPKYAGRMKVSAGNLPYLFEDMAYNTPVGGLSPVFETQFGLHLLRVDSRIPNPGEVKTRHILKMTRGLSDEEQTKVAQRVDSLRGLLVAGADFRQLAMQETEDPSGKASGGDLPWFGVGRMVEEFEEAAFALADGEISAPVKTDFGYHLILREASRQPAPLDSLREGIEEFINRDFRYGLLAQRAIDRYASATGSKLNHKGMKKISGIMKKHGGLNEASRKEIASLGDWAFNVDGKKTGHAAVVEALGNLTSANVDSAMTAYNDAAARLFAKAVSARMKETLADREPAYRNLINEYSDGMLLYEISNRMVWDRSNTDLEGLEAYFRSNRDAYRWDCPHYKGYVISAESDSIADSAIEYLSGLEVEPNAYVTELRKKFGTKAKIERVIAGRGVSPIIDNLVFGGAAPATGDRWKAYRAFRGEIAEQPTSALDVKGLVGMDYQQYLEDQWLRQLHDSYSVEIDRDLIKSNL